MQKNKNKSKPLTKKERDDKYSTAKAWILNILFISVFISMLVVCVDEESIGKTWRIFEPNTYDTAHLAMIITGIILSGEFIAVCLRKGIKILKAIHELFEGLELKKDGGEK